MPVKVSLNGKEVTLNPKSEWNELTCPYKIEKVEVNKDFYVLSKEVARIKIRLNIAYQFSH